MHHPKVFNSQGAFRSRSCTLRRIDMKRGWRGWCAMAALAAMIGGLCLLSGSVAQEKAAGKVDPAVERTRKQVLMLDDLYKSAIVLITEHYVEEDSDLAAGSAFQALFKAMKDKGYHEVR